MEDLRNEEARLERLIEWLVRAKEAQEAHSQRRTEELQTVEASLDQYQAELEAWWPTVHDARLRYEAQIRTREEEVVALEKELTVKGHELQDLRKRHDDRSRKLQDEHYDLCMRRATTRCDNSMMHATLKRKEEKLYELEVENHERRKALEKDEERYSEGLIKLRSERESNVMKQKALELNISEFNKKTKSTTEDLDRRERDLATRKQQVKAAEEEANRQKEKMELLHDVVKAVFDDKGTGTAPRQATQSRLQEMKSPVASALPEMQGQGICRSGTRSMVFEASQLLPPDNNGSAFTNVEAKPRVGSPMADGETSSAANAMSFTRLDQFAAAAVQFGRNLVYNKRPRHFTSQAVERSASKKRSLSSGSEAPGAHDASESESPSSKKARFGKSDQ